MKIYRVISDVITIPKGGPRCEIDKDSPWFTERFQRGKKIETAHPLPIKYNVNTKQFSDMPYSPDGFLVSGRFLKVIEKLSSFIQVFPSAIYQNGELLSNDYYTLVFYHPYSSIDWINTICQKKFEKAWFIKKLFLLRSKLNQRDDLEKIFAMEENPNYILITEEGKAIIEEAGIQEVMFEEIEVTDD